MVSDVAPVKGVLLKCRVVLIRTFTGTWTQLEKEFGLYFALTFSNPRSRDEERNNFAAEQHSQNY